MNTIHITPAGDRALLVKLEQTISEEVNDRVHGLMAAIEGAAADGVVEMIPTYCSLLIIYDPLRIGYKALSDRVLSLYEAAGAGEKKGGRVLEIPCCYGSHFGPDLGPLAELKGMSKEEIIKLHSSVDYRVYMLGFLPGFVYLGGMDKRLESPRLKTPRLKIPRGSVGIGGAQTGVYPLESPGGWQLIGGTPIDFFDENRPEPVLCRAGDRIRFMPIDACEFYDIRQAMQKGTYEIKIREADNGN